MHQINVLLEDRPAEELSLVAERLGADPASVARVLLTHAIATERAREESRRRRPAEQWDAFRTGLTEETVSVDRYAETI